MPPEWRKTAQGNMTAVTVTYMLSDQHGIYPPWCTPAACARIAAAAREAPAADVLEVDDLVVVRIPRPPAWL